MISVEIIFPLDQLYRDSEIRHVAAGCDGVLVAAGLGMETRDLIFEFALDTGAARFRQWAQRTGLTIRGEQ